MAKKKINLSDLHQLNNGENCISVFNNVNAYTKRMADKKVKHAKACTGQCVNINPNLPVITSPFDAYKLNTANNGLSSSLNVGIDPIWEAGEGTTSALPTSWIPAFVYKNGAWINSPFANANWISVFNNGRHSGNKDIYFRLKFNLGENVNPTDFHLKMDFYADNSVHEIFVNGSPQSVNNPILPQNPSNPYGYTGFQSGKQVSISLENDWQSCENEIIVHVKSGASFVGFLAQNSSICLEAQVPDLSPIVEIKWGDSNDDNVETEDFEVFYVSVRNPYNNVEFSNFRIGTIRIVDINGNPVAVLPDGTNSVELVPIGPYCFGDINRCNSTQDNSVYREFVLNNTGARAGKYKILLEGISFQTNYTFCQNRCFTIDLITS